MTDAPTCAHSLTRDECTPCAIVELATDADGVIDHDLVDELLAMETEAIGEF
jgi:hypothetical protein